MHGLDQAPRLQKINPLLLVVVPRVCRMNRSPERAFTSKCFSKHQSCARQKPGRRMTETQRNAETFVPPHASLPIPVPGMIADTPVIPDVCGSFAHLHSPLAGQTL